MPAKLLKINNFRERNVRKRVVLDCNRLLSGFLVCHDEWSIMNDCSIQVHDRLAGEMKTMKNNWLVSATNSF